MGNMKGITDVKITTALDYVSGTADRNGAILDMADYRGVLMIVKFATIAPGATTSVKAQQDTAVGGGTMADLLGTGITVVDDDDNQIFVIDLYEPAERYVRLVVDKDAANATGESAVYVQYGSRKRPVTNTVTDLVTYERHMTPAEGTA
jgi:hypothetical protein